MVHRLLGRLGKKERFIWFSSCSEALLTPGLCTALLCRCRQEGTTLPPPPQQHNMMAAPSHPLQNSSL